MKTELTAAELKATRERLGLGPVAMARAVGAPYATYYNWECGRRRVPGPVARLVALLAEQRSPENQGRGEQPLE